MILHLLMKPNLKYTAYLVTNKSFCRISQPFIEEHVGVKPLIHQSELRTYTKVVPFQGKSSFHFVVL